MFSSLVGVDVEGRLHQWKWSKPEATLHPRNKFLNLENEKVRNYSCAYHASRCSVQLLSFMVAWFQSDTAEAPLDVMLNEFL